MKENIKKLNKSNYEMKTNDKLKLFLALFVLVYFQIIRKT